MLIFVCISTAINNPSNILSVQRISTIIGQKSTNLVLSSPIKYHTFSNQYVRFIVFLDRLTNGQKNTILKICFSTPLKVSLTLTSSHTLKSEFPIPRLKENHKCFSTEYSQKKRNKGMKHQFISLFVTVDQSNISVFF